MKTTKSKKRKQTLRKIRNKSENEIEIKMIKYLLESHQEE
jgi:hypothetical protein